ncbi:flagellin, partial [Anaerovibrio sp.]|uniref:flagellin n=1 Tax=Anaerovibrio sp. TaxID=1872532 RepID=UPI003F17E938
NTSKGADITNVAEGAMQSQMELLTTIRELALKSANGIYSDSDRAIMQKEVNQRLTEIDDIAASASYNGRPLLNQAELDHADSRFIPGSTSFNVDAPAQDNSISLISETPNAYAIKDHIPCYRPPTSYHELTDGQMVYDANSIVYNKIQPPASLPGIGSTVYDANGVSYTVVDASSTPGTGSPVPAIEYPAGQTPPAYIPLDITTSGTPTVPAPGAAGFWPHTKNYQALGTVGAGGSAAVTAGTTKITLSDRYPAQEYTYDVLPDGKIVGTYPKSGTNPDRQMYSIDFSSVANIPADLDQQGFSVMCDACEQFISVMFDVNKVAGTGEHYIGTDSTSECYIIGLQGASTASDVVDALLDGLNAVKGTTGVNPVQLTAHHNVRLNVYTDAGGEKKCYIDKENNGLLMYNGIKGQLEVVPDRYDVTSYMRPGSNIYIQGDTAASGNTALKLPNTTLGMLFPGTSDYWAGIEPTEADYPEPWPNEYDGLTDEEKKQKFRREVWPYPEVADNDLGTCISTQEKARDFLTNIDQALRYLENAITTMGAQHQRLSVMNDNIVISQENTTAAESTIRDADMAKEMTAYARYSILSQSSQAMLAQANQSGSGVLSLLQG